MDSAPHSREKRLQLSRWLKWGLAGILFLGLGFLVRRAAMDFAVRASVQIVRVVGKGFFKQDQSKPAPQDELFPLWSWDRKEAGAIEEFPPRPGELGPVGETAPAPLNKSVRTASPPPPPQSSRASAEQVLSWAASNLVPHGKTVARGGGAPAGIELYGVGPLGLGLRDGDRLVSVDGRPVTERGQVIGAVLAARSQGAEAMTAELVRQTADGFIPFTIVVEQPYPEHLDTFRAEQRQRDAQTKELEPISEENGSGP